MHAAADAEADAVRGLVLDATEPPRGCASSKRPMASWSSSLSHSMPPRRCRRPRAGKRDRGADPRRCRSPTWWCTPSREVCMFSPPGRHLERGWPGRIEGDHVIQLAAQAFSRSSAAAARRASTPTARSPRSNCAPSSIRRPFASSTATTSRSRTRPPSTGRRTRFATRRKPRLRATADRGHRRRPVRRRNHADELITAPRLGGARRATSRSSSARWS